MQSLPVVKTLDLYHDLSSPEAPEIPGWFEHPSLGRKVDIVALKIGDEEKIHPVQSESSPWDKVQVGSDLFVVGFPLRLSDQPNDFPIYKGTTIASEPGVYRQGSRPFVYVDGKTRPGMSGSPVFYRHHPTISNNGHLLSLLTGKWSFYGVYSGRDHDAKDAYEAELGIVWPNQLCLDPLLDAAIQRIEAT